MRRERRDVMDTPSSSFPQFQQRRFATTSWSQVIQAAGVGTEAARQALEDLCASYWYPLYAFARRKGYSKSDAEELTQSFFAHLLENNRLELSDPARGRFRTFLITSLSNFMVQQWRSDSAEKRGGKFQRLDFDFATADRKFQSQLSHDLSPEKLFDRQWALAVLDQAMHLLEQEYARSGKSELFDKLKSQLSLGEHVRYADLAGQLGMSHGAVKVAVHRLRQRYRDKLREIIAQTIHYHAEESPHEIDDELAHLFNVFQ